MIGVLRALLLLAPYEFRERYGRELIADFHATLADECKSGRSAVPYVFRACVDLLGTIVHERTTTMLRTLAYTFRSLAHSPGTTVAIVVTLALATGANVAAFSVINGVLMHPLPFAHAERITAIWRTTWINEQHCMHCPHSPYTTFELRAHNKTFDAMAPYGSFDGIVAAGNVPLHTGGVRVGAEFFDVIGVRPQLGRGFTLADEKATAAPVAILSHAFWRTALRADPAIVGRTILVDAKPVRVVGVLPANFFFPNFNRIANEHPAIYLVLQHTADLTPGNNWMGLIGRMKAGVTRAQAQGDLDRITLELHRKWPNNYGNGARLDGVNVVPLDDDLFGSVRRLLYPVWAAVFIVLLVACLNVANLLLARSISRQRATALRVAVGATARHVLGQIFTETIVLSIISVGLGLILARYGIDVYKALSPPGLHRVDQIGIDWNVGLYAFGIALFTAVLTSVLPALMSMRTDTFSLLRDERVRGGAANAVRSALVAGQIACAFALVVSCGLFVRSFAAYTASDLGYDTRNGLDLFVPPINAVFDPTPQRQIGYLERLRSSLGSIPGIRSIAYGTSVPLSGGTGDGDFQVAGGARDVDALIDGVSPGYFSAIGIHPIAGRDFTRDDRIGTQNVVIVNEEFVRQFLHGARALGQRIVRPVSFYHKVVFTIVGVVPDVRLHYVGESPYPEIFFAADQMNFDMSGNTMPFYLRTSVPPATLTHAIANAWKSVDPREPVPTISSLPEVIRQASAPMRANAFILGVLAMIALVLAISGSAGVVAYAIARRTNEIGVRMALGARPGLILRTLLYKAAIMAAAGVALGVGLAALTAKGLEPQLYSVSDFDPATYAFVTAILVTATIVGAFVPAYRATIINRSMALRYE